MSFQLDDIVFMAGQLVPLFPQLPPPVTTEAKAEALFAATAAALRRHGGNLLANKPGAFDRLEDAALERERRYVDACEQLYGDANGQDREQAKPGAG